MSLVDQGLMDGDETVGAIVWLEGAALAGDLPHIRWIQSDDPTSVATGYLRRVFGSGLEEDKYRQYRLTLLQHLLQAWTLKGRAEDALAFVFGWQVDTLLTASPSDNFRLAGLARGVRRKYGETIARLKPSPSSWLENLADEDRRLRPVGHHLTRILATTGYGVEALRCWNVVQSRVSRFVSFKDEAEALTAVVEGLVRVGYVEDATIQSRRLEEVVSYLERDQTLESVRSAAARALMRVAAERGDVEMLATHTDSVAISKAEALARTAAVASRKRDVTAVAAHVDRALAQESLSLADQSKLFGILISTHCRRNDLESAQRVLDEMLQQGLLPRQESIAAILYGYAARHDVESVYSLHRRAMSEFGLGPDVTCSNALVTVHCRLQDIAAAEGAINRMRDAGVEPDLRTWTTLMNACVEVGDWAKAARIYAFLDTADDARLRPDTATFNVALKAAVYSSASVQSVLRLFRQMTERGLRPNSATYVLVMQSVCNAGIMDVAEDLFRSIDLSSKSESSNVNLPVSMKPIKPDVFHFSCLASGYIRTGQMTKARACLAEMRRRGIGPSSVTYGMIVDSFLRVPTKTNAERASKFAMEFIASSPLESVRHAQAARLDRALARGDELVNVFAPVLRNHVRRGNAEVALATFKVVLEAGAKPSIELYTILLDAYRQDSDPQEAAQNVLTVWRGVHESVLAAYGTNGDQSSEPNQIDKSQAHALCLPFNILMTALSRAGRYAQIEHEWRTLHKARFAFDCANWNAFAIALVESDKIERACWIVENVLMVDEARLGQPSSPEEDATVGHRAIHAPAKMPSRNRRKATQVFDDMDSRHDLSLAEELGPQRSTTADSSDKTTSEAVIDQVVRAQQARIGQLWFPYAKLLSALNDAIQKMIRQASLESAEDSATQARLVKLRDKYSATMSKVFERENELADLHNRRGGQHRAFAS
ncbi:hypothetical protein OIV83_000733 [Microbotryomycetes sp. JL201]|nr:hypothetical protein OIV83_000733 [Microbotryomycetes sp. JL201]